MSYDDPSQGHREAIKQLSESRATVRHYIRQLNADGGSTGVHPNLVAADKTPTEYSIATAALVDYLLQLRPYRDSSAAWNEGLGSVALPETFTRNTDVFGEADGDSTYEIQIDPVQEFPSLSHVINIASTEIVYQERVQNPYLGNDKIPNGLYDDVDGEKRLYQFVLTTEQLRQIFERADEVAGAMGFLAEMDMPDHSSSGGDAV